MATVITPIPAVFLAQHSPASFYAPGLSEEQFLALFEEFPDCFLEYTADGMVLIMPSTDAESGERVMEVSYQLRHWAGAKAGDVIAADGLFFVPTGARRGPAAAW